MSSEIPNTGNARKGDPQRWSRIWSIGIYAGRSPLELVPAARNPVLTAADVSDVDAYYVADPFMLRMQETWYMYFEVLLRESRRGIISFATSQDGLNWKYQDVVLDEPFHLSYPHVFTWEQSVYMIPESLGAETIRLYRAASFPNRFEPVADLIKGKWADPTIFFHQGVWWLLACSTPYENRTLHLFSAEQPTGPWREHPHSPIVADDQHRARPGGRVRHIGNNLVRFAQDCVPRYGTQLRAIDIVELGQTRYREREYEQNPVLKPSPEGWNSIGMHHMDAHQLTDGSWIACVDGDTLLQE